MKARTMLLYAAVGIGAYLWFTRNKPVARPMVSTGPAGPRIVSDGSDSMSAGIYPGAPTYQKPIGVDPVAPYATVEPGKALIAPVPETLDFSGPTLEEIAERG